MKALLMHPHRDFDPDGSLCHVMYGLPNARQHLEDRFSNDDKALIQDLELNILFSTMARGDEFVLEVARKAILCCLSNNTDTVIYRQQVLKDCLNNPTAVRNLYDATVEATEATRKMQWSVSSCEHPSSLLYGAMETLGVLSEKLRKLRLIGEECSSHFDSPAIRSLFAMLRKELSDEYLAEVGNHLTELKFRKGILLSAELDNHNEGINYMLRKPAKEEPGWFKRVFEKQPSAYTFYIAEGDQAGAQAIADMRRRGISRTAVAIAQAGDHVLSFFRMLRTELAFYVGCLNLHASLSAQNAKICIPLPGSSWRHDLQCRGLYDVCLALQLKGNVVGNEVDARAKDLVVITGANQGGKSTFLRSIGLAQLMMQTGMFVGAEVFEADLCPSLFTHYKRDEDASMRYGKLDEELARLSDIADRIVPNSILLCNESFAATNEREGSEIARQIVSALVEKGIRIFYVTHLYIFAHLLWERAEERTLFLRADRSLDASRTFKMTEGEPLETSYGEDLFHQVFAASTVKCRAEAKQTVYSTNESRNTHD